MILAKLHQTANWVMERRQNKWQSVNNSAKADIYMLHHECLSTFYQWLDQLETFQCKWSSVRINLYNLCTLKARLEGQCWSLPSHTRTRWPLFKHDLLFYLMINSLIHTACRYFKSFCDPNDYPSAIFLYPKLRIARKRLRNLLAGETPLDNWIQQVIDYPCPAYLKVFNSLLRWHAQLRLSDPSQSLIQPLLTHLSESPQKATTEQKRLLLMRQLLKSVKPYNASLPWSVVREALLFSICSECDQLFPLQTYIQQYKQYIPHQIPLDEEIDFWEQQVIKTIWLNHHTGSGVHCLYRGIIRFLKAQKKATQHETVDKFHKVKAIFNESPETFARLFHRPISRGLFTVNKSVDTQTVLDFFYSHITIYKKNGCGKVQLSTLLTYFKRMNSGDM